MNNLWTIILTIFPSMILANVLHMFIVKYNILPQLNKPISAQYFGSNKTWRGLVIVPLLNTVFLVIINSVFMMNVKNPIGLGLIIGLTYMLFELPNSFFKRRAGIRPGASASEKKYFFMIADKTDSAFGVALVCYFIGGLNITEALLLFLINSLTHTLISLLLVSLKIKSSF